MNTNAPTEPSHGRRSGTTGPTVLERSIGGVIACALASVPLAIGFSLWGFYIDEADTNWELGYVLISIAVVILFALAIAVFSAVCFGMPVYALVSRAGWWRPPVLVVSAVWVAIVVHETWHGGPAFEDIESTLQFGFFGLYSGVAFWLGADVWQPIK